MIQKPRRRLLTTTKMNKDITSLYIHIPFCHSVCTYCDFAKVLYFNSFCEDYLRSLKNEMNQYNINKSLKTVYIGGGTPTSISDEQFSFLLSLVDPYIKDVIEYTIEANPESLTLEKLKMMKAHGVNRLSIGVESTNDKILKAINRLHTFEDVKKCVRNAREVGFDNISFDLILGLPNVSDEMLIKDIINILSLNPDHLSCYSLTVHQNTYMGIKGIIPPSDDEMRDKYDIVNKLLTENGYIHYEISSWCKPNKYSRHNLVYWKDEQYYGLGLGASGFIGNIRYTNTLNLNEYNQGKYEGFNEVIDLNDDFEYLMLSLRTIFGINYQEYQERFGISFLEKYKKRILDSGYSSYFIFGEDKAYLNYEGMMILDSILLDICD